MIDSWQIDLAIVVLFFVGIISLGLYVGRGSGSSKENYFLGGRRFSWVAIGASLFATNINSASVLGEPGLTSCIGIAASNNELIGSVMLCFSALFFIPTYLSQRLYTVPEFLEKRFNRTAKLIFSGSFVLQGVFASPIGFYASGLAVIHVFGFPKEYLPWICLILGSSIGLYAIVGGLASVVYTDLVQACVLLLGCMVLTVFGLIKVGGVGALYESLDPGMFHLLRPASDPVMPWTAVVSGMALHSAFFALCSVAVLQRSLGASSVFQAQCGLLFGAFLKLLGVVVLTLPGLIALSLYPAASGDVAFPSLIRELLPVGASGLVLAGVLCATMSTADAGVYAISSVVALDLYPAVVKNTDATRAILVGRITAALVLVFGIIFAPYYANLGLVYLIILKLGAPLAVPVGTCYLFGRFSRRVNGAGAVATLITGFFLAFAYLLFTSVDALTKFLPSRILDAHFYHLLPFFFIFSTIILFGVSWLTPAPDKRIIEPLFVSRADMNAPTCKRKRLLYFWISLLLALIGGAYLYF